MSEKRRGPRLTFEASCVGCEFERSESYGVQGDFGHNVYCDHPERGRRIGDTTWSTPAWCPLLDEAKAKLKEEL